MSDYADEKLTFLSCAVSAGMLAAPALVLVVLLDEWRKRREPKGPQR